MQAAEAVRARIDWKYLLALDLADPGFERSLLCEFRGRLLGGDASERPLVRVLDAALLDAAREGGLLKARGRQRADSTHVLAAVRELNRIELLGETLRAALDAITVAAPDYRRQTLCCCIHHAQRSILDCQLPPRSRQRKKKLWQRNLILS